MAFIFILKNLETEKKRKFEITAKREYDIGRSEVCDVRVGDAQVSSIHLKMSIKNLVVKIEDLNTSNGSTIDGVKLKRSRFYVDSTVAFGPYELNFYLEDLTAEEVIANTNDAPDPDEEEFTILSNVEGLSIGQDGNNEKPIFISKKIKK